VVWQLARLKEVNPRAYDRFTGRIQRDGRAVSGEVNAVRGVHGAEWRLKPPFHSLDVLSEHIVDRACSRSIDGVLWKKKYKIEQLQEKSM
jgi:hypothetical protein